MTRAIMVEAVDKSDIIGDYTLLYDYFIKKSRGQNFQNLDKLLENSDKPSE